MVRKTKKVPMRMCLVCRDMKPKKDLIRLVLSEDKSVLMDLTGKKNGRGAYICKNRECLDKSKKLHIIERNFPGLKYEELYKNLYDYIEEV